LEKEYLTLIEKQTQQSKNPLKEAKDIIKKIADIFKFKKLIEEDEKIEDIYFRIERILQNYKIDNYILLGIDNINKQILIQKNTNPPYCEVIKNFQHCRAYRTGKIINDIEIPEICTSHMCKTCNHICIPFSKNGNFKGILKINIDKHNEKKEKLNELIPFLKVYLDEASAILESKYMLNLLHNQTLKDPLTELYNRKFLEEILDSIIAKAKRSKEKIGFLMLDMDKFKAINDTYGHKAGDTALKIVAQIIKKSIRKSDLAIRYGGEEFLIILQDIKSKNNLFKVAEKIRKTMEKTNINVGTELIKKTVSIGGSLFEDDCNKNDNWECLKKADEMLYEAKKYWKKQNYNF